MYFSEINLIFIREYVNYLEYYSIFGCDSDSAFVYVDIIMFLIVNNLNCDDKNVRGTTFYS